MSLALKLDRARQDLEYWLKIAEDSKLSSAAAQAARDQVRTYQAAVWCYEKAIGYQEQNRQERSRRTWANSCLLPGSVAWATQIP